MLQVRGLYHSDVILYFYVVKLILEQSQVALAGSDGFWIGSISTLCFWHCCFWNHPPHDRYSPNAFLAHRYLVHCMVFNSRLLSVLKRPESRCHRAVPVPRRFSRCWNSPPQHSDTLGSDTSLVSSPASAAAVAGSKTHITRLVGIKGDYFESKHRPMLSLLCRCSTVRPKPEHNKTPWPSALESP